MLLYADSLEHPNDNLRHVDEIKFEKPVTIDQIKIVRKEMMLNQVFRQIKSKTQAESFKEFQVFYKDLKVASSKFSILINEANVN